MYSWQTDSNFYFPGNYVSVAKQFLRCVFSQLVRNEIFFQLFQCEFESKIKTASILPYSLETQCDILRKDHRKIQEDMISASHYHYVILIFNKYKGFELLETLAVSLQDFNELNSVVALRHIIKDINLQKVIIMEICMIILNNVAVYIQYLSLETNQSQWTLVLQEFETLFRQMEPLMIKSADYTCLFLIMGSLLKVPAIATTKV
jgi:hypothetical protein